MEGIKQMSMTHRLQKIVTRHFRSVKNPLEPYIVEGIPQGLSFDLLNEICNYKTGESIKKVSGVHLSGWKKEGAFRLFIENYRGHVWNVIYKNAIYKLDHIPALEGFPLNPGPAEFAVYNNADHILSEYLPEVYYCNEVKPGERYQYLLEDLGTEYEACAARNTSEIKLGVVAALPRFHQCLQLWASDICSEEFPVYDYSYASGLVQYSETVLHEYRKERKSNELEAVINLWPTISGLLLSGERASFANSAMIHGDANVANILVHKEDPSKIKAIDWEWAGFGCEFADVVSLYRRAKDPINRKIVNVYMDNTSQNISKADLYRKFQWCRLERCLLDAVYIAAQHIGSAELEKRHPGWASKFIDGALKSLLGTVNNLLH